MSQLISRILLTILLFPSATLVLIVSFLFLDRQMDDEAALIMCALLTCGYMATYWVLLWRRAVIWTPDRIRLTMLYATAAVITGAVLAFLIDWVHPYANEVSKVLGCLSAAVLWIIATIIVWRETPSERSARLSRAGADALVCPSCGYNLTGLREARCPECGASFTLNELFAAQPARAGSEVEQV